MKIKQPGTSSKTFATWLSSDGKPWSTPVYFAYDKGFNLYWASAKNSCHSANIAINPAIFISTYDSTASEGSAVGLYINAIARELGDIAQVREACECLYGRAPEGSST